MKIKEEIYEQLIPLERIRASFEAIARDDEYELGRLLNSCPRMVYEGIDPTYRNTMNEIVLTHFEYESKIRDKALYLLMVLIRKEDFEFKEVVEAFEITLSYIANLRAAWEDILGMMGIDINTISKALRTENVVMDWVFQMLPEPDPGQVKKHKAEFYDMLQVHLYEVHNKVG